MRDARDAGVAGNNCHCSARPPPSRKALQRSSSPVAIRGRYGTRSTTKNSDAQSWVRSCLLRARLRFEARSLPAADKLRNNLEPSDYKHVALGLIFLKHISDAFEAQARSPARRRPARRRRPGRIPRRKRLLGAEGSPLVASSGQRQAAHHRQADRRRHARDRGGTTPASKAFCRRTTTARRSTRSCSAS